MYVPHFLFICWWTSRQLPSKNKSWTLEMEETLLPKWDKWHMTHSWEVWRSSVKSLYDITVWHHCCVALSKAKAEFPKPLWWWSDSNISVHLLTVAPRHCSGSLVWTRLVFHLLSHLFWLLGLSLSINKRVRLRWSYVIESEYWKISKLWTATDVYGRTNSYTKTGSELTNI